MPADVPNHRLAAGFAAALSGWVALLALIVVVAEPTRDAVVFGTPQRTLAALTGTDVRIISIHPTHLVVRGGERGYARTLYANGALLVLPARATTCLDLSRWRA